jgi:two-component system chemotaxis response regulator CheB
MPQHDIIVMGASVGGISAIKTIVADLPGNLPAAVFVVIHTTEDNPGRLPSLLNRVSKMPVLYAVHDTPVLPGRIYLARPGRHLVLDRNRITLSTGPRENRHRPAADVLFRSAAQSYGPRVVGVVLTGNLDDGALGLAEIKARKGLAIVQDPEDAYAPSMPRSALQAVDPDYVLPLQDIASHLTTIVSSALPEPAPVRLVPQPENGGKGHYSCPECGGALEEVESSPNLKFRCRVGHSYAAESLVEDQADGIERALWAGIRSLEEHAEFCGRLERRFKSSNRWMLADRFGERSGSAREHAKILRELLDHAEQIRRETDPESESAEATGTEG